MGELYALRPCCEIHFEPCLGKFFTQYTGPLNDAGVHLAFKRLQVGQCELFAVRDHEMLSTERGTAKKKAIDQTLLSK